MHHTSTDGVSQPYSPPVSAEGRDRARQGGDLEGIGPTDTVDVALAKALEAAATAGRFEVVAQLARELEARRLARSANVVPLVGQSRDRHDNEDE
jgi:hypothetical protein